MGGCPQALPPSPVSVLPHLVTLGPPQASTSVCEVLRPRRCRAPLSSPMGLTSAPLGVCGAPGARQGCSPGWPQGHVACGELGTSGWAPRRCSHADSRPRLSPQSYCLKVKEMDDEEYSCIVSAQGQGTPSLACLAGSPKLLALPGTPGGPGQPGSGLGRLDGSCS